VPKSSIAWDHAEAKATMANPTKKELTKKGALSVTQTLDRLASLVQAEWQTLQIPERVAKDAVRRFDVLADHIDKVAGIERTAAGSTLDTGPGAENGGWDPKNIGKEVSGPLEYTTPPDEEWVKRPDFTQEENRELRLRQQNGDLGMTPNPEQMPPSAGRQASALRAQLQAAAINGSSSRLVKALALAAKIAEEEEKGMPDFIKEKIEDKKKEDKKAGEVPEAFKKNWDKGEGEEEEDKEAPNGKKASHGFNLSA